MSYIVAAPIIHMGRSFHSHLDDCQYEGFLLGLTTSRYPDETAYVSMCNMATANWKKTATSVVRPARSIKDSIKGIVHLFKQGCVKDLSVYYPRSIATSLAFVVLPTGRVLTALHGRQNTDQAYVPHGTQLQ